MSKLVSNNQGLETARLARDAGLPRGQFQTALTDGTMAKVMNAIRDGVPIQFEESIVSAYPHWVRRHLTPELESMTLRDPGEVEAWTDVLRFSTGTTGSDMYLLLKRKGLLKRSLSFGELKFFERNPDRIPAVWTANHFFVYGWASVVVMKGQSITNPYVPCLICDSRPYVEWREFNQRWSYQEPAGLRK